MFFPKRQDYLGPFTGIELGDIVQQEITREFLIDSIYIFVAGTVTASTGAAATPNPDGINNILKRVTLQVTDGARTRNVVDCSGPGLLEYSQKVRNIEIPRNGWATTPAAGANFGVVYPIYFRHPQIADPQGCMTLLPCNRFSSNPLLTLYFGTQADIDQDASPTFDTSSLQFYILINRRQVGIDNWPIFDTELIESSMTYPATQANALYELPTPGSYTGILCRGYAGVAPNIGRSYNVTANGDYKISVLGTVLRRAQPAFIQSENDIAGIPIWAGFDPIPDISGFNSADNVAGSTYFDFLNEQSCQSLGDFGSVLDTNGLIKTGARAQILVDVAGGAGVKINYLWHRIYGNLASMKSALKIAGQ